MTAAQMTDVQMADVQMTDAQKRATELLSVMTLAEKIGQLNQVNGDGGHVGDGLRNAVAQGAVGSVLNEVSPEAIVELQRVAREESPHGIPLLMGRDVIHGFKTIFPIPLGMAASWNDELVRESAQIAAREARGQGVNWTFSPMLDVSRDPRWGRVAESYGEDPLLTARMGVAMINGYQGEGVVSCLKHFVGYGASESGRDYNRTYIPEVELRNVYLPPFHAGIKAGAMTVMPSFSDLNGRPPTANEWLLRDVLREQWGFTGFVVSDWESISQLAVHGVAADEAQCALLSAQAGVNMDMAAGAYANSLSRLVEQGSLSEMLIDELVLAVLLVKFQVGLFDQPLQGYVPFNSSAADREVSRRLARESMVLLKNTDQLLPLDKNTCGRVALLGPLADQPYEQLGTWIFDGDESVSISLRAALEHRLGDRLCFHEALANSRDNVGDIAAAVEVASQCDVIVVALGEEAILSGEAHCRADITLPGAQAELVRALSDLGVPIVGVVLAGRPLALSNVINEMAAVYFAWHPGCMAGPALCDLLFGEEMPSGKLPITLPRDVGQVPIYYAHGQTGKPPTPETVVYIDHIDARAPQLSVGNTSFHLDVDPSPLFPFGHGLSYTEFAYNDIEVAAIPVDGPTESFDISVSVTNQGSRSGTDVVQLYAQDVVARIARPIRELKDYRRVFVETGQTRRINFKLMAQDFAYHDGQHEILEAGELRFWVGGSSTATLECSSEMYR